MWRRTVKVEGGGKKSKVDSRGVGEKDLSGKGGESSWGGCTLSRRRKKKREGRSWGWIGFLWFKGRGKGGGDAV